MEKSSSSDERGLFFVPWVIPCTQIERTEPTSSAKRVQTFANQRQWVGVFAGFSINGSVVNAEPGSTILFPYQHYVRGPGGPAWFDNLLLQHLFDLLIDYW